LSSLFKQDIGRHIEKYGKNEVAKGQNIAIAFISPGGSSFKQNHRGKFGRSIVGCIFRDCYWLVLRSHSTHIPKKQSTQALLGYFS
jgi:hypothetical protein